MSITRSPHRESDVARNYAPKAVLRHLPLDLVRTFLAQEAIHTGADWEALAEGDTPALCRAWLALPPRDCQRVEQMLRMVHELATEAGVQGLIAEAFHRGRDVAADLADIPGHHAKALWVLLHHPPAFHVARQLLATASPAGRYWHRTPGFAGRPYNESRAAVQNLRLALARLYRDQGRGHKSTVEHYERGGCLYVFRYLDDYTHTHTAHDPRGTLTRAPLRPAFEVVYVYTAGAGALDLYARGDRRWRAALVDRFCEHVLHTAAPFADPRRRSYQLDGLIDRSFQLTVDPARGIVSAAIRKMRVVAAEDTTRR
ncbi:MAG: hypothetical protein K2V38_27345, partial [Gemmataceae bacterium]|nr:hypothetical protein [Gemmataceae bacterium]